MHTLDPHSLGKHVDRLYRAAWALCGSREDAEDLVQETFVRVLSRPRVLHGQDDLHYLMRVLRNTFLTGRRTAGRRPPAVTTLDDVVAPDPKLTGRPEQALEMQELYGAIATLPDDFRLALVAVDVLGLSYREAARALRVREATVTTRLFRARKQVARRLLPAEDGELAAARHEHEQKASATEPKALAAEPKASATGPEARSGGERGRQFDPGGLDRARLNRTVRGADGEGKPAGGVLPGRRTP
jgi:RNA polymerase sigma-70 factor (ECF subfamily)